MEKKIKPPLSDKGKVFIITAAFPPVSAGSSILNRNLFSYFDENSYEVFIPKTNFKKKVDVPPAVQCTHILYSFEHISSRIHILLLEFQIRIATMITLIHAWRKKPVAIIATYPEYGFLKIGYKVAKRLNIPFIPYLHDTISEALSGSRLEQKGKVLQDKVFSAAAKIFVMSEGMSSLYLKKYNIHAEALPHTYMEPIPDTPPQVQEKIQKMFFWGGDIYGINTRSVKRISDFLGQNNSSMFFASTHTIDDLKHHQITGNHIQSQFFSVRSEYLNAIQQADFLVLALNWPDESKVHEDELATIFPTKSPEYLASGKPIIVHCPEHYFLSRFFKERNCGIILSDRNPEKITQTLESYLNNPEAIHTIQRNALEAAQYFNQQKIALQFKTGIDALV